MRPNTAFYLLLFFLLILNKISAQREEQHSSKKEHGIYEIIISGIYSFDHEEGIGGTEVHFTYWFDHTWGAGLSYTAKFEEAETLQDIALLGSWNPRRWVTLNVGPNFILPSDHREFSVGAYAEAEINVRPNEWFHFGPVLGGILGRESELVTGFHIGFEF